MSLPTPAPVRASAIDLAVEAARARIRPRVTPERLAEELTRGALVVDTRSEALRRRDGAIDGAVAIERNVLEWRLDPTSAQRMTGMDDPHRRVIIVCDEGYASSLAAAGLLGLGLTNVTDLVGGYQGWRHLSGTSEPPHGARAVRAPRLVSRDAHVGHSESGTGGSDPAAGRWGSRGSVVARAGQITCATAEVRTGGPHDLHAIGGTDDSFAADLRR